MFEVNQPQPSTNPPLLQNQFFPKKTNNGFFGLAIEQLITGSTRLRKQSSPPRLRGLLNHYTACQTRSEKRRVVAFNAFRRSETLTGRGSSRLTMRKLRLTMRKLRLKMSLHKLSYCVIL